MNVFNTCNNLLIDPYCSFFMKTLMLDYIIEKFTIATILHNQVKFCLGFNNLITRCKYGNLLRKVEQRSGAAPFLVS